MNNKLTPKDFFFHLGATIALYAGAIAIINLAFSIIDYTFPDILANYFSASSVAWPISMLVVLVPVLYIFEWLIGRDIRLVPEKTELWIARWRSYLTLFLAGATIVVDIIVLINTYLNGEVSTRFIYKVLAVLIIAAIIFAYYILRRTASSTGSAAFSWSKALAIVGIILAVIAIVGGFIIVGSPSTQRALRLDQQRVNDLSNIQWQIVSYWQSKQALPDSLTKLNDNISGFSVPVDPETLAAYIYKVSGKTSFQLCATFAKPSASLNSANDVNGSSVAIKTVPVPAGDSVGASVSDNWAHAPGLICFDRTIDPQKYPPLSNIKN